MDVRPDRDLKRAGTTRRGKGRESLANGERCGTSFGDTSDRVSLRRWTTGSVATLANTMCPFPAFQVNTREKTLEHTTKNSIPSSSPFPVPHMYLTTNDLTGSDDPSVRGVRQQEKHRHRNSLAGQAVADYRDTTNRGHSYRMRKRKL